MAMDVLKQCEKEISNWPEEVREDLADALVRLERGHALSMPLSRPMPSIGSGVHELRLRDRTGVYRVIYFLIGMNHVWLIHAFQKKTQRTPPQDIALAKERLKKIRRKELSEGI